MKKNRTDLEAAMHRIGRILLTVGVVLLAVGILLAFAVGTVAVPIVTGLSILLNAAGVTLLRWRE